MNPEIRLDSAKYSVQRLDNITYCRDGFRSYESGETFTLFFDPMPQNSSGFSLIEGEAAERGEDRFFNYLNVVFQR